MTAYANTVVDGQTGLLVGNDPAEWQDAFQKLKADPSLRESLASAAFDYVKTQRLLGPHTTDLIAILNSVVADRPITSPS